MTNPGRGALVCLFGLSTLLVTPAIAGEPGTPPPGTVGLTFDDGPDPIWTPVLLDILDEYDAVATFFVLGHKVDSHPELAREIVERGHSIQIHGYHHNDFTGLSDARIRASLMETQAAIYRASGVFATCFRPPGGIRSERVTRVVEGLGLTTVMWSRDSGDYAGRSPAGIVAALGTAGPGDVVVGHDIWGWVWREALPLILDEYRSRGVVGERVCPNRGPFHPPTLVRGIGPI